MITIKKKYLCIIPARGGSKGIPNKNLTKLGDNSILGNTILQAQKANFFDYIHVSTDSLDIKMEALEYGASCEFLRPKEFSNDTIGTREAIKSSISSLRKLGKYFDYVFELQPTYVFRKTETLNEIKKIIEKYDAVVTVKIVRDTGHPDYICTSKGGLLIHGKELPDKFNRHKLREKYAVIGLALASKVEVVMNYDSIFKSKCSFYEVDNPIEMLDINEKDDLFICRQVYKELNN